MLFGRLAALAALLPLIAGCGATLTRGPHGWQEGRLPYTIAPLAGGGLLPRGWTLQDYEPNGDGFRRQSDNYEPDLGMHRTEDDGVLFLAHHVLPFEERAKIPEALLDRWVDSVVRNPKDEDDDVIAFSPVVNVLTAVATSELTLSLRTVTTRQLRGRGAEVTHRGAFDVAGDHGADLVATLSPIGAPTDRELYVAVVKPASGESYVVVAYGNTPTLFDKGLPDAMAFARRLTF